MAGKARIAVIGAGLMGHGIAQVFALAGHDITITDAHKPTLDSALSRISTNLRDLGDDEKAVSRVKPVADLAACVRDADYVVEAILEDMPLKQKTFAEIEQHVRPNTILASNTSVMPITEIMQGLKHRERALDVAAAGFGAGRSGCVVVLDWRQRRAPRQRAQAVAVEVGQDRVEPAPHLAAVKQMLGAQRPDQRVLHQVVGDLGVARQRPRIAAQRRNGRLDITVKCVHQALRKRDFNVSNWPLN